MIPISRSREIERQADLILEFDTVNKTWYIEKYRYGEDKVFTSCKSAMLLINASENPIIRNKFGEKKGVDEMEKTYEKYPWEEQSSKKGVKKPMKPAPKKEAVSKVYSVRKVKDVIYSPPATIIQWTDGTKTVVKVADGDEYDPVFGFLMAYFQRSTDLTKTQVGKLCDTIIEEFGKQQAKKYKEELEEVQVVEEDKDLNWDNVVPATTTTDTKVQEVLAVPSLHEPKVDVSEVVDKIVDSLNKLVSLVDKD